MQRPDKFCKEMIESLAHGMQNLQQFVSQDQRVDPHVKIEKQWDQATGSYQLVHRVVNNNFETQSIQSGKEYKMSAIGEMNNEELEQLNEKKNKKMKEMEQIFKQERKEMNKILSDKQK